MSVMSNLEGKGHNLNREAKKASLATLMIAGMAMLPFNLSAQATTRMETGVAKLGGVVDAVNQAVRNQGVVLGKGFTATVSSLNTNAAHAQGPSVPNPRAGLKPFNPGNTKG